MAAALVVSLLALLPLLTGRPQHALAEYALSRAFGAEVSIEGLSTFGTIRLERAQIAARSAKSSLLPPVIVIENIEVDYGIPGISARVLGSVVAERVHLNFNAPTGEESNFDFLFEGPADEDQQPLDPKWLPENIEIQSLNVRAAIRDARAKFDGIMLRGGVPPNGNAVLELSGDGIRAEFAGIAELVEPTAVSGSFIFRARVDGREVSMNTNGVFENTGEFDARGRASLSHNWLEPGAELEEINATINSASLDGTVLDGFLAGLSGGTVAFDTIIAEPSRVEYNLSRREELPAIQGAVLVQGLRLDAADHTIYRGDMTISADVPGGQVSEGTIKLSLDESHVITADLKGTAEQGSARIHGDNWEKDKLAALLPQASHGFVQSLEFERAGIRASVDWDARTTVSEGSLVPVDAAQPLAHYQLSMPVDADWSAAAQLRLASGTFSLNYTGRGSEHFDLDSKAENIALSNVLLAVMGPDSGLEVQGNVTGEFSVQGRPEWDYLICSSSGMIASLTAAPVSFDKITMEMQGRINREMNRAEISHFNFDAGDGVTVLNIADVVINMEPFYIRTNTAAVLDLANVARWYEEPGLFGEVEIGGAIGYADGKIELPMTVRCTTLGYGDLVLPYRTTIQTEVALSYNTETEVARLDGLKMLVGEGTLFVVSQANIRLNPIRFEETYFDLYSDLAIGTGLGLFASAQGSSRIQGRVGRANEVLGIEWQIDADVQNLVFPEAIAAAEGLTLAATGTYDGVITGSGAVSAERVTVAGGHITGVGGALSIADSIVSIPDLRGDVFNGRFAGNINAKILEPGLPVDVNGRLTDIDLAIFTNEVQPPETKLTGIADATFFVRNTLEGPEDLEVFATSAQGFSMNRDLVRRILESEALKGALGIAQLEKTVSRFLGEAPQRPFDSAEMRLNDEGDRLRGTAVLLSEKTEDYNGLNLTIELAIDDEALLQTLKMLQESEIQNVHF